LAPHLAQEPDRLGQRELLAREAGDEAAAANLAARLETAVDAKEIAPRRQPRRLALEHAPEDDAVAAQERACKMLDRGGLGLRRARCRRIRPRTAGEGPAAGILHGEGGAAAPERGAALLRRHEQRAEAGEAVARDEADGDELGQCLLDFGPQEAGPVDHLVEEGGAVAADEVEEAAAARAGARRIAGGGVGRERRPVRGMAARRQ